MKRSGGMSGSTCFFFSRSLSVGWTQAWRQAKMVRMRKWRRRGGRRAQIPDPCPASPLSCRRQNFLSGPRCIGQLWRVPQIKITSWEDSDAKGRWVWVGGCRKRIEGWVASHLLVSFASCSSPTQEQVFCLLMRIVVEILSESLLWSPGRKAVMGRSTSFGGVLVRCQM